MFSFIVIAILVLLFILIDCVLHFWVSNICYREQMRLFGLGKCHEPAAPALNPRLGIAITIPLIIGCILIMQN